MFSPQPHKEGFQLKFSWIWSALYALHIAVKANHGPRREKQEWKVSVTGLSGLKNERAHSQMNVTAWEEHWLIRKPGHGSRERVAKGVEWRRNI